MPEDSPIALTDVDVQMMEVTIELFIGKGIYVLNVASGEVAGTQI